MSQTQLSPLNSQLDDSLDHFTLNKLISFTKYPVYLAHDIDQNKPVALKLFPIKSNSSINFLREIQILSALSHPNIIKLYETASQEPSTFSNKEDDPFTFVALEYASYGDLFEIVSRAGHLPENLARTLFSQLLDSVEYMHSKNVAHLDLKAENILLDENYCLKVTDFDLAQPIDDAFLEGRGTPGSRAPEIKEGTSKNFAAADVYSMGIILFVMMSGISPYREVEVESGEKTEFDPFYKLMRQWNAKFWELHAKHQQDENYYSKDFISLVNAMLAENSKERPKIDEIREHSWMKQDILVGEDYKNEIEKYLSRAIKAV